MILLRVLNKSARTTMITIHTYVALHLLTLMFRLNSTFSGTMRSIFILIFLITSINCLQDSSSDVVRVRMPFHSDYKAHWPPFWIYDNTTDTVTGYLKDLLDAVFTSANLSYSLAGISDVAAFRAKGYNSEKNGNSAPQKVTILSTTQ